MKLNLLLLVLCIGIWPQTIDSKDDGDRGGTDDLCSLLSGKNQRNQCTCIEDSSPPWGQESLRIDCRFKNLQAQDFHTDALPMKSETLDLSWNKFETIPTLASDDLKLINLMHNNLTRIVDGNFAKLANLRELYLNWNGIQVVSADSFAGLVHLRVLDLSHNNLKQLSLNAFAELKELDTLALSWNRYLDKAIAIDSELDFYSRFGVALNLRVLSLEKCNLQRFQVHQESAKLVELNLRNNNFERIPNISAPRQLRKLDFSENPIRSLIRGETENLPQSLEELLLDDMPNLERIDVDAFAPLSALKKLSIRNCRNLARFDEFAFGLPSIPSRITLQSLNLQGSALHELNSTLLGIFRQLTDLELNGNPLNCDCELLWLKQLPLDTNAKCWQPARIRGITVKNVPDSEFVCDRWPSWVHNGVICLFVVSFAVLIITVAVMLRPQRGAAMRGGKVGAGSPYARITIEPNRSENNF